MRASLKETMHPYSLSRRAALAALAGPACMPVIAQPAGGRQARPTELIVPAGKGGPLDVTALILAEAMGRLWRQRVSLQYTSGAVSGALAVARSSPDGSRIGLASPALCINAALRETLPYSTLTDLAPVCLLGTFQYGIFVNNALPVRNVAELISYVQRARSPVRYASPGVGTGSHLAAASLAHEANLRLEHVPFTTNGAAEKAVADGQLPLLFNGLIASAEETRKGPLRLIGLMGERRVAAAARLSSVTEVLPGFEFTGTLGVVAPKGLPFGMVRRLGQDITEIVLEPRVRQRLADVGVEAVVSTPDEYEARLRADIARWRLVGRITNVQLR